MVEGGEHISAEGELSEEERQMNVSKQSMQSGRNTLIKTLLRQHTPNTKYNNLHYQFIVYMEQNQTQFVTFNPLRTAVLTGQWSRTSPP